MQPIIDSEVLDSLKSYFLQFPDVSRTAARMAINDTVKGKGMAVIRNNMMDQINFDKSYLTGDRLGVLKLATDNNLEAAIRARDRATSLARFASGSPSSTKKSGVSVRVKKGRTTYIKRGWLVRLRAGASLSEDKYNLGLAIRLGPGESITNKKTTHRSWLVKGSVALLYGPSVAQVFDDVRDEVVDPFASLVEAEFLRQLSRLLE